MIAGLLAAAAKGVDLSAWLVPGATVLAAALGAVGLLVVRIVRGPVTIQDLWKENRQLRIDLAKTDAKVDRLMQSYQHQMTVNRVMGEGFDALSNYVERTSGAVPSFTWQEREAVERARALRSDDLKWATLQPQSEGESS